MTLQIIQPVAKLSPEQAEFVAFLRGLLDEALAGRLVCLVGVVCDHEGNTGYAIGGEFHSIGDTYLALHNVADMVRVGDLESMLGLDDSEE